MDEKKIDEAYSYLWEDSDWLESIMRLDNDLLNQWIRVYYQRYWKEKYPELSDKWKKEIIEDCQKYSEYFDWIDRFPYVKEDIVLSNKECSVLEHILENYSGLRGFDIGEFIYNCATEDIPKYKESIRRTLGFPC